ncbi:MAG: response regulator [Herpetosiphon sp.]|nr:response regulator [Herpetosiphon sp.]
MSKPHVLIVDDNPDNRDLLSRLLARRNMHSSVAENGEKALAVLRVVNVDLILLDIMMPVMNGYQVLEWVRNQPDLRHIPIIVISAADDLDSVVKGIQLGADDYLAKPFNPTLLRARISAALEKKRLRDQEQEFLHELARERVRSERLLLNILPARVAERLKDDSATIADQYDNVTVMFADVVGFTRMAGALDASEVVRWLNDLFSAFDRSTETLKLEKIKIIGDAYMVAGGLNDEPNHAQVMLNLARDFQAIAATHPFPNGEPLNLRIGIHSGPVVAGVIGTHKFAYDLWGDTVNLASRMETHAEPATIQMSVATYQQLDHATQQACAVRTGVELRNVGTVTTYVLKS